ncbi:hypothetical protein B0O99DRAFT_673479 [Bisporella sp. PMI_857]|nr:hypothetical protein B0O99DRAFT_673479 [Bisporella sp. PMI_857]
MCKYTQKLYTCPCPLQDISIRAECHAREAWNKELPGSKIRNVYLALCFQGRVQVDAEPEAFLETPGCYENPRVLVPVQLRVGSAVTQHPAHRGSIAARQTRDLYLDQHLKEINVDTWMANFPASRTSGEGTDEDNSWRVPDVDEYLPPQQLNAPSTRRGGKVFR